MLAIGETINNPDYVRAGSGFADVMEKLHVEAHEHFRAWGQDKAGVIANCFLCGARAANDVGYRVGTDMGSQEYILVCDRWG